MSVHCCNGLNSADAQSTAAQLSSAAFINAAELAADGPAQLAGHTLPQACSVCMAAAALLHGHI